MYLLLNMGIFHCFASLPEGIFFGGEGHVKAQGPKDPPVSPFTNQPLFSWNSVEDWVECAVFAVSKVLQA